MDKQITKKIFELQVKTKRIFVTTNSSSGSVVVECNSEHIFCIFGIFSRRSPIQTHALL